MYEILCGEPPFNTNKIDELHWMLKTATVKFPRKVNLSPHCRDLVLRLLKKNPHQRISWEEFFAHPWFGAPVELPEELKQYVLKTTDILLTEYRPLEAEFVNDLNGCLIIAQLADELASEYGRNGKTLTLYMKFLTEMKKLCESRDLNYPTRMFPFAFVFN